MVEQIGRYRIIRELGRGGMATVFLAEDPHVNRHVAVKVLPAQFTHDQQFRARFQREAQTIAKLEHPAIVPVYDFGEDNQQPYIVMRYMQGGSLADRIRQGFLPMGEALSIVQRIASALEAAHQHGIIHRDLKPGNILFDQYNNAYLADFGIVKLAESNATFTGTGIIGSPAYMSPEQAQGGREIDKRTDIYALGIIIFEMLTGKSPFEADTPVQQLMKHIMEPPPTLSRIKPDLPANVDPIVNRALAKDPNDRFPTATDLANALVSSTQSGRATVAVPAHQSSEKTQFAPPAPPAQTGAGTHPPTLPLSPTGRHSAQPMPTSPPIAPATTGGKGSVPWWLVGAGILLTLLACGIAGIFLVQRLRSGNETEATATVPILIAEATQPLATATITSEPAVTTEPVATATPLATKTAMPTIELSVTPTPLSGNVVLWHSWAPEERAVLNRILASFQQKNPEIALEELYIPFNQIREQFEVAVLSGNAPTIILGTLEWGSPFLTDGYIQDVAPLLSSETLNRVHPTLLSGSMLDGQMVGLPYAGKGVVLYRNSQLIPEPLNSFDDLLALDEDLYDLEQGLYYSAGTLLGMGGQLTDADGRPAFNTSTGEAWLNRVRQFNDGQSYGDADLTAFENGTIGLVVDGTWNGDRLARGIGAENLQIDPWFDGMAGFIFSDLAMLTTQVPAEDMAANVALITHFLIPQGQIGLLEVGRVPAVTDVTIDKPFAQQILTALESGVLYPMQPELDFYWVPLSEAIDFVVTRNGDPSVALQRAEDTINAQLP